MLEGSIPSLWTGWMGQPNGQEHAMNVLGNALVTAGLVTRAEAENATLTLKELKAKRDVVLIAAIAAQGATYNRSKTGTYRAVSDEQAELLALNDAISRRRRR